MYRMDCVKVDTLISGEIDCADFKNKLLLNKEKPAIINVNIGKPFFVVWIQPFSLVVFLVNINNELQEQR